MKPKKKYGILSNRLYVDEKHVKEEHLNPFRYRFKERVFDELFGEFVVVEREHAAYRHNKKAKKYGFHRGNEAKIRRIFHEFEIIDKRVTPKFGFKLKRKFKLRPEQKTVTTEWLKNGFGILKAPVRWGKTYGGIYLSSKLGVRTLILSDKSHLCRQWLKTFYKITNLNEIEKKMGKQLAGIFTTSGKGKLQLFPITVGTFQSFWSQQKRRGFLKKNRNYFGFVLADETHHVPADTFGAVTSSFNARYRCGVTATDKRRDQKHHLLYDIIGPITGIGKVEQLPCKVVKHQTDIFIDPKTSWGWMTTLITKSHDLNELVVEQIVKDVQAGRFVLVHTERVKHCHELKEMIQDLDMSSKVGIAHGGVSLDEREKLIRMMNKEKLHVIVGAKVIQEGLTFKRPDVIHIGFSPTTNPDTWEQITGRVRTPMKGKPKPIIHDWRLKGHGGVYASAKARDKLYTKKKWPVEEALSGNILGGKSSDPAIIVPKFCGNCSNFFDCRDDIEVSAKDVPCESKELEWVPIRIRLSDKLQIVQKHKGKVLGEWMQKFIGSLEKQSNQFWSNKQKAILQRAYEQTLNHRSMHKWPDKIINNLSDEDEEE